MRPKRGLAVRGRPPIKGTLVALPAPRVVPPVRLARWRRTEGPVVADGNLAATTPARVGAYFLDTIVTGLITVATSIALDRVMGIRLIGTPDPGADEIMTALVRQAIAGLAGAFYFVGLWTGGHRTAGMRLLRLRVVRAADAGPVTFGPAIVRWAVLFLPDIVLAVVRTTKRDLWLGSQASFLVIGLAGYVWTLVLLGSVVLSGSRRGLHDRASGTVVINVVVRARAVSQVLELSRDRDRVALIRLAGAVRAAYDRSAMIYADADLATWIGRWMTEHGRRLTITVLPAGGLRFADGDTDAWAAIRHAVDTSRFD